MFSKNKILIVEDNRPVGNLLRKKLEDEGFQTFLATDGKQGLSMAISHKPDVIACDITLPKLDGYSFIEKLREDAWGKNCYIFMITNSSESSSIQRMLSLGITTYFVKSDVTSETIIEHIKKYLENNPQI